jgi:hypothetical protein
MNNTVLRDYLEGDVRSLTTLHTKDLAFSEQVSYLLDYLASTYSDKYEDGDENIAREIMMESKSCEVTYFNIHKYLKRYETKGFGKSQTREDLWKAIHYILFELQRNEQQGV